MDVMLQNDCINKMSCLHLFPFELNKCIVWAALISPHDGLQRRLLSSSSQLTPPLCSCFCFSRLTSLCLGDEAPYRNNCVLLRGGCEAVPVKMQLRGGEDGPMRLLTTVTQERSQFQRQTLKLQPEAG